MFKVGVYAYIYTRMHERENVCVHTYMYSTAHVKGKRNTRVSRGRHAHLTRACKWFPTRELCGQNARACSQLMFGRGQFF